MQGFTRYIAKLVPLSLVLLIALLAYLVYCSTMLSIRGEVAQANCTNVNARTTRREGGRSTTYTYHVSYVTKDGQQREGTLRKSGLSRTNWTVGDSIEILHDPLVPGRVAENNIVSVWWQPGILGIICLALAYFAWVGRRSRQIDRRTLSEGAPTYGAR